MNSGTVLPLLLSTCVVCAAPVSAQQRTERRFAVSSPATVIVQAAGGSVHVIGWDRASVELRGSWGPHDSLAVTADRRRVELRVVGRNGREAGPARLELHVPVGGTLEVETVAADVVAEGSGGVVKLQTASGAVRASGAARAVTAESVSGDIDVHTAAHTVIANSATGTIRVSGVRGFLEAHSTRGAIEADNCLVGQANLTTVGGDIRFAGDFSPEGVIRFDSYAGTVDLLLPRKVDAAFDVSTFGGEIHDAFGVEAHHTSKYAPGKALQFVAGRGSAHVTIDTFGGDITLRTVPVAREAVRTE